MMDAQIVSTKRTVLVVVADTIWMLWMGHIKPVQVAHIIAAIVQQMQQIILFV